MRPGRPRAVGGRAAGGQAARIAVIAPLASFLALGVWAPDVMGQQGDGSSVRCEEEAGPIDPDRVSLSDFAWLAGSWRGEGPGGAAAEIHYMPPAAGVLPSVFRLRTEDRTVVLEAITLVETEESLTLYVRHFTPALEPLEEEGALELRLAERRGDCFLFRNVREQNPRRSLLRRTGPDRFLARSELRRGDGTADEIRVEYRRVGPP